MINFTGPQTEAINTRNATLVVSASAGSGKTTVMIQRIAEMIIAREVSLSSLLVLTFARSAALDMRRKLKIRLDLALEAAKGEARAHLLTELSCLSTAQIGTFHKFCGDVVRTYFAEVGVDPAFSIIDDAESNTLKSELLDSIIARMYKQCEGIIELFCANRTTEPLKDAIISVTDFLNSRDDARAWLDKQARASYDTDLENNIAMRLVIQHYQMSGKHYHDLFVGYLQCAELENAQKVVPFIRHCIELSNDLVSTRTYEDLHRLRHVIDTFTTLKCDKTYSVREEFKACRNTFKDLLKKLSRDFALTRKQMSDNQAYDLQLVNQFIILVTEFMKRYADAKKVINKLDFTDLEQNCAKILQNREILFAIKNKCKYVFVDEYQDTNPMQEYILSHIASEDNLFIVGDVKQSIYGFRSCDPTIFARKINEASLPYEIKERDNDKLKNTQHEIEEHKNVRLENKQYEIEERDNSESDEKQFAERDNYKPENKQKDASFNQYKKGVQLNENFRSNPRILEFVNCVFSKIMNEKVAGIDYASTSKFKINEECKRMPNAPREVEVILVDTASQRENSAVRARYNIKEKREQDTTIKVVRAESALVAERISKLLGTKIYEPSQCKMRSVCLRDITILVRHRTHIEALLEVLRDANIPASVALEQDATKLIEITLLNNMLRATTNFTNDVPLVMLMSSFVFGFSAQDLANVRVKTSNVEGGENAKSFYHAIKNYIKQNEDELSARLARFISFLEEFHALSKFNSVADMITMFCARFQIIERLLLLPDGKRVSSNIRAYIEKMRGAKYAQNVSEFCYYIEHGLLDLKISSSDIGEDDCVQIMTIHASKGLEFPIVILFGAETRFRRTDIEGNIVAHKDYGLSIYSSDTESHTVNNSIARMGATIAKSQFLVAEEMRLLYVALTRAKDSLIIVGACKINNLNGSYDDYDILGASSHLDFLAPTIVKSVRECDFDVTVISVDEIEIKNTSREGKILYALRDKREEERLRELFTREYPHKAARDTGIKTSVTSLTHMEDAIVDYRAPIKYTADRGTDFGTMFHKQMQHVDFFSDTHHSNENVRACVAVIAPIIRGMKVHKEINFLRTIIQNGEEVVLQGVIDLLAIDKSGRAIIIDYKTTRASEKRLKELYAPQLNLYADSVRASNPCTCECFIYSTVHKKLIQV